MNALEREGFIALGGPLEGTNDVLRVSRVAPWNLRLGSL